MTNKLTMKSEQLAQTDSNTICRHVEKIVKRRN